MTETLHKWRWHTTTIFSDVFSWCQETTVIRRDSQEDTGWSKRITCSECTENGSYGWVVAHTIEEAKEFFEYEYAGNVEIV